jgi:uncharacterized repeat protein (TIGR03803 family)
VITDRNFRRFEMTEIMSFAKFTQTLLLCVGFAAVPSGRAQTYTVLYSFTGGADGALPLGGVILDSAGNLYGTTRGAGEGGFEGSVFKLSPKGKFTLLHSFGTGGAGGAQPYAGLVRDSAGNLYGTTSEGGLGAGTVFKLDRKGNFSVLHSFSGTDGAMPTAPLILDPAGNLYGTTFQGGDPRCRRGFSCGVVFKLDPEGNETVLHAFTRSKYGRFPYAGLLRDSAGNLYGTTTTGGHGGFETVFEVDAAGNETVLSTFQHFADGADPWATLIRDAAGNFYGTTTGGGKGNCGRGCGVVFKVDTNGNETVLHTFTGNSPDSGTPLAGLVMDSAGNLYGTTFGNVFTLDPAGNLTVLHTITPGEDGEFPYAGLTMDSAGNLYGTTYFGGNLNDCLDAGGGCGVVFKITP